MRMRDSDTKHEWPTAGGHLPCDRISYGDLEFIWSNIPQQRCKPNNFCLNLVTSDCWWMLDSGEAQHNLFACQGRKLLSSSVSHRCQPLTFFPHTALIPSAWVRAVWGRTMRQDSSYHCGRCGDSFVHLDPSLGFHLKLRQRSTRNDTDRYADRQCCT